MIRRPPRSTHCISSAASDVYKRQGHVVGLAEVDPHVGKCFGQGVPLQVQENFKEPELYEIRFVEDEEDSVTPHVPFYGAEALDRESCVGCFLVNSLAFCRTKEYEEIIDYARLSISFILMIELGKKQEVKFKEPILDSTQSHKVLQHSNLENSSAHSYTCRRDCLIPDGAKRC
eukprot:TRINITY_DN6306_c0_g1_i1.p1 TRINITY_DN6306_c0_g1~~TRINITY_DN6306_c0_g1_i1.p1  ORF type:complete len:181 (+),score=37.70 TRINITY_DN6306_c0_g1_i1:24-545(+)